MSESRYSERSGFCFEDLIAPVTPREFFDLYWEKSHLFIARSNPRFYESLFSFAGVDQLMFLLKEVPREVLTLVAPPGSGRKSLRRPLAEVPMARIYRAFESGDTIRLSGVQNSWPAFTALTRSLERALSARFAINVYMTPAGSQGFSVHADTHDAFILQVGGSKEWFIYEPDYPLPNETLTYNEFLTVPGKARIEEDTVSLVQQTWLEQGDLLYIPRGVPHKAIASDDPSLHLTVGIHPLYWVDAIKASIEALAMDRPELRAALPPRILNDRELQEEMKETFRSLLHLLCEAAPAEITMEELARSQMSSERCAPDDGFAELMHLKDLHVEPEIMTPVPS